MIEPSLSDLISLQGKTAVITGAASGMGAATARRFAEAGADLHLLDINKNGLESLQRELVAGATAVAIHTIDLSQKAQIDQFWDRLPSAPSILINNAGIFPFRGFLDTDEPFIQQVMDINLYAVYWMCQQFVRHLLDSEKNPTGAIVNISSIEALLPFKEDLAHYTISKAGVISLTRALSRDYGRKGIRANVILPGAIQTEGTKNARKEVFNKPSLIKDGILFQQRLSLGRWGQADEVARINLVLASDLSSYMNGAVVPVDGGFLSS